MVSIEYWVVSDDIITNIINVASCTWKICRAFVVVHEGASCIIIIGATLYWSKNEPFSILTYKRLDIECCEKLAKPYQ